MPDDLIVEEVDVPNQGAPDESRRFAELAESIRLLAAGDDLDSTLGSLLTAVAEALDAPVAAIYLSDPDRTGIQLAVTIGLDDAARSAAAHALGGSDDPVVATARDQVPIDVRGEGRTDAPESLRGGLVAAAGLKSATFRPLGVRRDGIDQPAGVLAVGWPDGRNLDEEQAGVLDAHVGLIAVAVDRGRLASLVAERSEWFERMAHTDPLTGLANQRTFARILELELARAGRQGGELSVAIFDVDGLADTNARAGHEKGDDVLRAVASVLAESVRLVDTVARYGGDEFVVVAPGAAGVTVARRVVDGIAALPLSDRGAISVSAGVARFPADGASGEELIAAAERALAEARNRGRGSITSAPTAAAEGASG
jgi:diguanylate cyclase (GGDEF)-like protein